MDIFDAASGTSRFPVSPFKTTKQLGSSGGQMRKKLPLYLSAGLLLSATLLQKIALPGTGGALSVVLVITPVVAAMGLAGNILVIDSLSLICFGLFMCCVWISFLLSTSADISVASVFLLIAVQFPLLLRFDRNLELYSRILKLISTLAFVIGIGSLLQFGGQFIVGRNAAFIYDYSLLQTPLALKGFDFLIPLYYSSPVFKSNGIFFAEPSFASQFLALGIATELVTRSRLSRLGVMGGALLCSYSGTGMMMLAFFMPWYVVRHRRFDLVFLMLLCLPALFLLQDVLQLDAITRRFSEFSSTQSSGFARFFSSFYLLSDYVFVDPVTALFGRGPGTVQEHWRQVSYEAFDPTWGKLTYEYGILGAVAYAMYFTQAVLSKGRALAFPLAFTYALLGGYLLNPFVVAQLCVVLAWPAEDAPSAVPDGTGLRSLADQGRPR